MAKWFVLVIIAAAWSCKYSECCGGSLFAPVPPTGGRRSVQESDIQPETKEPSQIPHYLIVAIHQMCKGYLEGSVQAGRLDQSAADRACDRFVSKWSRDEAGLRQLTAGEFGAEILKQLSHESTDDPQITKLSHESTDDPQVTTPEV